MQDTTAIQDKATGIVPALLSYPLLEAYVGLDRTRIYALMREGAFPRPLKIGKTSRWPKAEVDKWIANLGTTPWVPPGKRKADTTAPTAATKRRKETVTVISGNAVPIEGAVEVKP